MNGQEFYEAVLKVPKYQELYEENLYFNQQLQYIRQKQKVTQETFLNSIGYLSNLLLENEIRMIRMNDEEAGI